MENINSKNGANLLSWPFVIIVAFVNAYTWAYLNSLPCDYICSTVIFPVVTLVSGVILGIYPFCKFSKKQIFIGIVLIMFAIFSAYVIEEALVATKALANPGSYHGFKHSGIPEHGIWFSLFSSYSYTSVLFEGFVIGVGTLLGFGFRWVFKKIVPSNTRILY
jgi:hypothetical protein